ncbi:TylF/MycF/NovP-related O-methyltransferase [Hymenobacter terrenus]|uniref:TylF/MycF/NovP-related O-methyltransferase n=1 Tax=Hymenobacter terrenus TaxID=1629124 RepID=UPI0006990939|nr:TylF/MycF/NovP-related O-methyltransferase [Hymenobacter terrenus]
MSTARFLFQKLAQAVATKGLYFTKSLNYKTSPAPLPPNLDYVRYATLGLCYQEIVARKVPGNVAELGVYRGDFAKRLNQLFADRELYLFDTFSGFDRQDIVTEQSSGFSTGTQNFADTSAETVLQKMPHPQQCIVRKGFFPATAAGLDDTFCFVSLDADLYQPILEGLAFFYPRLAPGGYIFVHDFNNDEYKGAHQAVLEFCQAHHIGFIPLPDSGGTAVITK